MKTIATLLAVSALCFGSFARAATAPASSERPSLNAEQSAPVDGSLVTPSSETYILQIASIDADRWTGVIVCAVLLAFAACAYLPKCYRSVGACMRYIAELMRDPLERFCIRLRRCRLIVRALLHQIFGRELAINSAVDLSPRQQAIATNILRAIGVSESEDVVINAADSRFVPGRVTEYDRNAFLSVPQSGVALNASQFSGNNPHEFLSNFAIRYQDPNAATLEEFTDLLAPAVMSNNSRFVEYAIYSFIDAFLALDNSADDIRAVGADFPTLRNPSKQLVTQRLNERGLAIEVDEAEELLDPANWQQDKVGYLIGILSRTRLRRAVALFVAIATGVAKTWDTSAGKDPDQDIMDELGNLPIRPTDIVYGTGAFAKRSRSHRAQTTAGGFASANAGGLSPGQRAAAAVNGFVSSRDSVDELAGIFGVNSVRVSRHRRATGAATIGDVIGSLVLMFTSMATPSRDDYTNLKTFRAPAMGPNGQNLGARAVYVRQVGDKRWRLAVSVGSELVAVTSSIGAEVVTVN